MNMRVLSQIENKFSQLAFNEQLWLIERLVQHVRETTISQPNSFENDLVAMANDPQIQNELHLIEEEFSLTEMDGLEIA